MSDKNRWEMNDCMAKAKEQVVESKFKVTSAILCPIDNGFGWNKYLSSIMGDFAFPSIVAEGGHTTKTFRIPGIDRTKMVVTTDDGTYTVGDLARNKMTGTISNRTVERDRANDPESRTLFRTNISLNTPDEEGEYNVIVQTGLPNADYSKQIKENLEEFLKQPFEISFDLGGGRSISKKIKVERVEILRQPEGTIVHRTMRFNPKFKEDGELFIPVEGAAQYVGVIDVGQETSDYCIFDGAYLTDEDRTCKSAIATNAVYDKLRTSLAKRFAAEGYSNFSATDTDLDIITRTGSFRYAQEDHDCSAELAEAVKEVAEVIVSDVARSWGNEANRLEEILITGGGAEIFYDALVEAFEARKVRGLVKVDMSQYSNVMGYYIRAVMSMLDEGYDPQLLFENYAKPYLEMMGENDEA
jgi:hypothetical protein